MIHNTLAEELGINLCYTAFKVEKDRLHEAVAGADAFNILGMNVTVPHKCEIIKELSDIDPLAARIGAVNTLVRVDGGYKGYNTDAIGLYRELEEENIIIKDKEVIILGAGGASNAITYICADKGAAKIYLLNRTFDKAKKLADDVNSHFGDIVVPLAISDYRLIPGGKYPVIQTTSCGLYPNNDDAPIYDKEFYELVEAGVDSFKIEGRAKSSYYVSVVTNAYRNAIDCYLRSPENFDLPETVRNEVFKVSHRAYCTGFFFGHPKDCQYYENSGYIRNCDVVGIVLDYYKERRMLKCVQRNKFLKGSEVEILPPKGTSVTLRVDDMYNENFEPIESTNHAAMIFYIKSDYEFPKNTIIRINN